MSSLFDDSFLADLQPPRGHGEEPPPPPEDEHGPEQVPDDLFGGKFDVPPDRDAYYRDGAPRPVVDPAALLEGLNENQRAAVVHSGTPLLIVAGAGSGKTRVLTHRIAHLLGERQVHPGQILAITFTNKAAGEMKERVEQLVGPRANAMWVMTFHSACVRILRRESKKLGFTSSFSIYDAADSKRLMALVCRDLDLDPKRYPPKSFSAKISNLKNELIDEEDFAAQAGDGFEKTLAQAYAMYQSRLREANALDFDDLIMTTVNLLRAFPDVSEHYRRRFRHVLVDEYQDTNHAQYALVRELVGTSEHPVDVPPSEHDLPPAELCVVGDADQSIYAFRGATIRNILQFEEDYPDATTILLEQNYRSTQTILTAANAVIERNESRRPKNLWTNAGAGARITGYVADTEHDEAQFVADEIDRLTDAGEAKAGDVAVFYRTNAQSRVFEEVFIRVGLPYKVVGGVRFYERKEVRDVLAYLRVLANPEDSVPLRRILNVPKRGIGDRAEAMIDALSQREKISFPQALKRVDEAYGMAARSTNAVKRFNVLMEELRTIVESGAGPATVLEAVLERTGYLAELQASTDPQDETRIENLQELAAVALEFEQESGEGEEPGSLSDFLERVALVADSDQIPDEDEDGSGVITLMTLHTAKGLEFPVVFLTGMEDGVFPHMRALGQTKELEEERRLAYVGITRARERLYLTRSSLRSAWGQPSYNPPSRFLEEIPAQHVDWKRTGASAAPAGPVSAVAASLSSSRSRSSASGASGFATRRTSEKPVVSLAVGDRVTHDQFGLGTVVGVKGTGANAEATIDFGEAKPKRLLLRYAPVEKL
ncbi:DNA helicase-2/ATP-dependent DNA helicase PcrA [Streptomyces sp. SAI-135]|uniref:DNA helicase PcrA n=1 Tax=unclassified Streptomyces TaxID=2593676 RepID=UPI002475AC3B|nr:MULTISPECIES: DNA helicase PcrA [unclassified Streptomyces]MDH6517028.1 DNA helicase-2/ATP-dependent DNA helicase PcrA [Streptomyces sp. SAI-090]MDH6568308.1 DNA helicase-2/ATP-dependent DNA helicase PcrA [Streptomyces sp. SAI-117]MDH6586743.1 DNA helicase-2/ATP-dependent DNA helicase PcrA [Streptomyces sp. SAI-133]MDH6618884.1 DNA helicase-2/ATP-dependent DNA helicase PcrA [Streptomyces sp. SAI-135]